MVWQGEDVKVGFGAYVIMSGEIADCTHDFGCVLYPEHFFLLCFFAYYDYASTAVRARVQQYRVLSTPGVSYCCTAVYRYLYDTAVVQL